jgi:hypothetical protein
MYALRIFGQQELATERAGYFQRAGTHFYAGLFYTFQQSKTGVLQRCDLARFLSDESQARITFEVKNLEFKFKGGKTGFA